MGVNAHRARHPQVRPERAETELAGRMRESYTVAVMRRRVPTARGLASPGSHGVALMALASFGVAHLASGLLGVPSVANASVQRSCGTISVTLSPGDTRYARNIAARNVSCSRARRVARAVTSDPGEGGTYLSFRCDGTNRTITCRRARATIRWRY